MTLKDRSAQTVAFATFERVDWFKNLLLLGPIDHIPPVEYEEAYYRSQETQSLEIPAVQ